MVGTAGTFNQIGKAVYLSASSYLRFAPALNYTGNSGSFIVRGVDNTMPTTVLDTSTSTNVTLATGVRVNVGSYNSTTGAMSAAPILLNYTLTAVNDAPTLTVTSANPTFTEGGNSAQSTQGAAVNLFSGVASATGPANESGQVLTQLTVTVSGLADGGNEMLRVNGTLVALTQGTSGTNTNGVGYSVSVVGSTATVTITPPALNQTVAMMDNLITNLAYQNTQVDNPTAGNRVVTITGITDSGGTANSGQDTATFNYASTVNVVGVNDAPTGSVTISGTVKQGQTLTASNSLADADGLGTISYSWFADGVAIGGATASTYTLTANEVGKLITAKASYTDGGNNATVVTSTASAAVASSGVAGDSVIALGSSGNLIAPVQVEGKWYYYWDLSGDGTFANTGSLNDGDDSVLHSTLDSLFIYDINGNINPDAATVGTTDVYRYATINGVKLALPTINGGNTLPVALSGVGTPSGDQPGTAASGQGLTNNSSYDDLLAFWDAFNGTSTATSLSGTPADWSQTHFWSATVAGNRHLRLEMARGTVDAFPTSSDTHWGYVALEVVKPNAAPELNTAASPAFTALQGASQLLNGQVAGTLVNTLVSGISDADSTTANPVAKGIAITGFDTTQGTLYYSLNGGNTWTSVGTVSDTSALLLSADSDTRLYFVPANSAYIGTTSPITFRAWDGSFGSEGARVDTSAKGGAAAFSLNQDTVAVSVSSYVVNPDGSVTMSGGYLGTAGSNTGASVSAAGDVNGDGYDDVIVAALSEPGGQGAAYVVYGNASGSGVHVSSGSIAASLGFKITATAANDITHVESAGDFNGDGYADVLVNQFVNGSEVTENYVIYGKSNNTSFTLDANTLAPSDGIVVKAAADPLYQSSTAIGDVNGDGLSDLFVMQDRDNNNPSYVVYGSTNATSIDLADGLAADKGYAVTLNDVVGDNTFRSFASMASAGDLNGDGLGDFLLSKNTPSYGGNNDLYVV
jgi:hypothetical protein